MQSAEERAFYGALSAEWTLARGGKLPPVARQAIPAGPGARAGAGRGGAARGRRRRCRRRPRRSGARDGRRARRGAARPGRPLSRGGARSRRRRPPSGPTAAKLDPFAPPSLPGRLRDAARADDRTALGDARRAGGRGRCPVDGAGPLARGAREPQPATGSAPPALREGLAPVTWRRRAIASIRRRRPARRWTRASLDRLRAGITGAAGVAMLSWIEAGNLARRGELAGALAMMERAIAENPDAIPLGLLAQQIAADSTDAGVRATAFDLWLRSDPGRRAEAALALAAAREAASSEDPTGGARRAPDGDRGRAGLGAVLVGGGGGRAGGAARRRGRDADLRRRDVGPERAGARAAACALSHLGLADPTRAFDDLQARLNESRSDDAGAPLRARGARAARGARRQHGRARRRCWPTAADAADPDRAASLAPRRAGLVDAAADAKARARRARRGAGGGARRSRPRSRC